MITFDNSQSEQPVLTQVELEMNLNSGIAAFEAKHFSRAMQLLSPLCDYGHAEAQYRVAVMLQNGLGMARNELQAYRWMRAAAEQDHGLAQHGLGFMYLQGECVNANEALAAEWFERAAEHGLAGAQINLGMMYLAGRGVPMNKEKGRELLKKAGIEEASLT